MNEDQRAHYNRIADEFERRAAERMAYVRANRSEVWHAFNLLRTGHVRCGQPFPWGGDISKAPIHGIVCAFCRAILAGWEVGE